MSEYAIAASCINYLLPSELGPIELIHDVDTS